MAEATIEILSSRVGAGGQTNSIEVKRVEELLWWVTPKGKRPKKRPDKKWDDHYAAVWTLFQQTVGGPLGWPVEDFIDPDDKHKKLIWLAMKAGVVSPLPATSSGAQAAINFYNAVDKQLIPYGWTEKGVAIRGGTRMIRGWRGNPYLCVYTTAASNNSSLHFDLDYPATLNCSSFANLMLSVYHTGGCHGGAYNPVINVGGMIVLGKRYNLVPLKGNVKVDDSKGVFNDVDKIWDQMQRDKIYHFAKYKKGFGITHDMVMINGVVYESNKCDEGKSSLRANGMDERAKSMISATKGGYIQVYGPAGGVMV